MIRLDNISKQNGHQILFIEASAALNRGEKVGLVGPNGAGKTTLFRLITGREQPDEGQVASDRGITIGYFSQDVGDMRGRSAVAETMDGAGPVSAVAAELAELEAAMADPRKSNQMEDIIERYGEVQGRFEELGGYDENRLVAEDVAFLMALKRLGKTRGQKLERVTSAKVIVSTRKFDEFGDWHVFSMIGEGVRHLLGWKPTPFTDRYWYKPKR